MIVSGYISFIVEFSYTFQCLRDYCIGGSSLNTLRTYFVLSLDVIHISFLAVMKGKYSVVRFLPLRCSLLYIIYFSYNSA